MQADTPSDSATTAVTDTPRVTPPREPPEVTEDEHDADELRLGVALVVLELLTEPGDAGVDRLVAVRQIPDSS